MTFNLTDSDIQNISKVINEYYQYQSMCEFIGIIIGLVFGLIMNLI